MTTVVQTVGVDVVRHVVQAATRAPSVHNSQPWSFGWDGRVLTLREDLGRSLPVLDPGGRDRTISCGAVLQHALAVMAGLGIRTEVEVLPDSQDPCLLARITVCGTGEPRAADRAVAAAVWKRATVRERFGPESVPEDVLEQLHRDAEAEGAWLRVLGREGHDDLAALQVLTARAEQAQRADPAYLQELRRWRHDGDDGVPDRALPRDPVASRASSWAVRDFSITPTTTGAVPDPDRPPDPERPTMLLLGTPDDDRASWLAAGRALGRVLLTVTAAGLAAQPLSQLFEAPALRLLARRELGVLGWPHLLLRVGTAPVSPVTARRSVEDVLTIQARPDLAEEVVVVTGEGRHVPALLLQRECRRLVVVERDSSGGAETGRGAVRVLLPDGRVLSGALRVADEREAEELTLHDPLPRPRRDVVLVLEPSVPEPR